MSAPAPGRRALHEVLVEELGRVRAGPADTTAVRGSLGGKRSQPLAVEVDDEALAVVLRAVVPARRHRAAGGRALGSSP